MIRRSILIAAGAAVLAFGLVAGADARMVGATGPQPDSGTAYFAITHQNKTMEFADGDISDKVLGNGAVTYSLKLASGSAAKTVKVTVKKVVLYTSTGSLSGTATATITNLSNKTQKITDGKLTLTKGFGSLQGDTLTATFSGTADLATNMYVFTYKGHVSQP